MGKKNIGGNFDDFLKDEAVLEDATAVALKRSGCTPRMAEYRLTPTAAERDLENIGYLHSEVGKSHVTAVVLRQTRLCHHTKVGAGWTAIIPSRSLCYALTDTVIPEQRSTPCD